ncbi:hypothetical protein [Butyrivibrio sp. TB]|uniref:hypothetical protein n=1 Tax=Butyrivibrio sp. TB TaxID=1520809 RepID=UPI0008CD3EC5|nr:hypothetical protein [Butyrivibrio sp. TB]SEQ00044.1 hypothetical protein SAMN02910382_01667 [Butyrivibrio sp. TB]
MKKVFKFLVVIIGVVVIFRLLSGINKTELDITEYDKILTSNDANYVRLARILRVNDTYAIIGHFKDEDSQTSIVLTDDPKSVDFSSTDNMGILAGDHIEYEYMAFDGERVAYLEYTLGGSDLCSWHLYDISSRADVIVDTTSGDVIDDKQNPRVFFYRDNLIYEKIDKTNMKTDICSYDIDSKQIKVLYTFSSDKDYISYGMDVVDQYLIASVNDNGLSLLKYDLESDEEDVYKVEDYIDTIYSVAYAKDRSEILYYGKKNKHEEVSALDSNGKVSRVYRLSYSDMVNNEDIVYSDGKVYLKLVEWKDPISSWNYTLTVVDLDSKKEILMNRVGDMTLTDGGMYLSYYPENTRQTIDVYYVSKEDVFK